MLLFTINRWVIALWEAHKTSFKVGDRRHRRRISAIAQTISHLTISLLLVGVTSTSYASTSKEPRGVPPTYFLDAHERSAVSPTKHQLKTIQLGELVHKLGKLEEKLDYQDLINASPYGLVTNNVPCPPDHVMAPAVVWLPAGGSEPKYGKRSIEFSVRFRGANVNEQLALASERVERCHLNRTQPTGDSNSPAGLFYLEKSGARKRLTDPAELPAEMTVLKNYVSSTNDRPEGPHYSLVYNSLTNVRVARELAKSPSAQCRDLRLPVDCLSSTPYLHRPKTAPSGDHGFIVTPQALMVLRAEENIADQIAADVAHYVSLRLGLGAGNEETRPTPLVRHSQQYDGNDVCQAFPEKICSSLNDKNCVDNDTLISTVSQYAKSLNDQMGFPHKGQGGTKKKSILLIDKDVNPKNGSSLWRTHGSGNDGGDVLAQPIRFNEFPRVKSHRAISCVNGNSDPKCINELDTKDLVLGPLPGRDTEDFILRHTAFAGLLIEGKEKVKHIKGTDDVTKEAPTIGGIAPDFAEVFLFGAGNFEQRLNNLYNNERREITVGLPRNNFKPDIFTIIDDSISDETTKYNSGISLRTILANAKNAKPDALPLIVLSNRQTAKSHTEYFYPNNLEDHIGYRITVRSSKHDPNIKLRPGLRSADFNPYVWNGGLRLEEFEDRIPFWQVKLDKDDDPPKNIECHGYYCYADRFPTIIPVAALKADGSDVLEGQRLSYTYPTLLAPGENVLSGDIRKSENSGDTGYGIDCGSSFAAPLVAATIAEILVKLETTAVQKKFIRALLAVSADLTTEKVRDLFLANLAYGAINRPKALEIAENVDKAIHVSVSDSVSDDKSELFEHLLIKEPFIDESNVLRFRKKNIRILTNENCTLNWQQILPFEGHGYPCEDPKSKVSIAAMLRVPESNDFGIVLGKPDGKTFSSPQVIGHHLNKLSESQGSFFLWEGTRDLKSVLSKDVIKNVKFHYHSKSCDNDVPTRCFVFLRKSDEYPFDEYHFIDPKDIERIVFNDYFRPN